jgi:two-component system sensor kinase FixL
LKTLTRPEQDTQSLLRLQERLTQVSRMVTAGEMLSGIAHELNQPLAAVTLYAQACDRLLSSPDPDINEIREALQEIASQSVRAGQVLHRLRDLAAPERHERETLQVNDLIAEIAELIRLSTRQQRVRYREQLARDLPNVHVDRAQIQQLVLNLVRNSLESLADMPLVVGEITVGTLLKSNGTVEIFVRDNGKGLSPLMQRHLFEPFRTTKAEGTGLGLSISRAIADAHGATLEYRPTGSGGACFSLCLPAVASLEAVPPRHTTRLIAHASDR